MNPRLKNPAFLACLAAILVPGLALPVLTRAMKWYLVKQPIQGKLQLTSLTAETRDFKQLNDDRPPDASILESLGTHNTISRYYLDKTTKDSPKPRLVELHAAYYTGTIDTVPHVPDRCMVGAGYSITGGPWFVPIVLDRTDWLVDDAATAEARKAGYGDCTIYTTRMGPASSAPGTRVRLPRGIENLQLQVSEYTKPGTDRKLYAGYFFIANGGLTPSAEGVRLLAFDLRSDYSYYLKVQFSSENVAGAEGLAKAAADMLAELLPDLMLCVPDWAEVIRGDYPPDNPRHKGAADAPKPGTTSSRSRFSTDDLIAPARGVPTEGTTWPHA